MVAERTRYGVRADRTPKVVSIERHLLVGRLMDYQAEVSEALNDCKTAIQYAAGASVEPGAVEAIRILLAQRATLTKLQRDLRLHCGAFDGVSGDAA